MSSPQLLPLTSILVLGAGELGVAVLDALAKFISSNKINSKIHCLLRPATLASPNARQENTIDHLQNLDVTLIQGDLADSEAELARIFASYEAIVSCTGFGGDSGTQLKITRAALAARVRRFVPWQFGVDYDAIGQGSAQHLFDEQLGVRRLLRDRAADAGLQWLIVSTGVFISFIFWEPWQVVVNWRGNSGDIKVQGLGSWQNRLTVTAVEDIGTLTAHALFDSTVANEIIYTAGETFEWREFAATIERSTGRTVRRQLLTEEDCQSALRQEPGNGLVMYKSVFSSGVGVAWEKSETYNTRRGVPTLDVEAWLRKHLH